MPDLDSGTCAFGTVSTVLYTGNEVLEKQSGKEIKWLVPPDFRFQNMEAKIDTLADQLPYLFLVLKKGQTGPSKNHAADHQGRQACTKGLVLKATNLGMAQSNVCTTKTMITGASAVENWSMSRKRAGRSPRCFH